MSDGIIVPGRVFSLVGLWCEAHQGGWYPGSHTERSTERGTRGDVRLVRNEAVRSREYGGLAATLISITVQ